jgi:hypothetical protein
MTRTARLLVFVAASALVLHGAAANRDDPAADQVAAAFVEARQAAHLPALSRMGRNVFAENVCQHDLRFPSGLIGVVNYETVDPAQLPESATKLATTPDSYKLAKRFGVGVCVETSAGQKFYSVLIATYESRWTSFLRIFWE